MKQQIPALENSTLLYSSSESMQEGAHLSSSEVEQVLGEEIVLGVIETPPYMPNYLNDSISSRDVSSLFLSNSFRSPHCELDDSTGRVTARAIIQDRKDQKRLTAVTKEISGLEKSFAEISKKIEQEESGSNGNNNVLKLLHRRQDALSRKLDNACNFQNKNNMTR
jgi:hypothetical protein